MVRKLRSLSAGIRQSSRPTFGSTSKFNKKVFKALKKARKAIR